MGALAMHDGECINTQIVDNAVLEWKTQRVSISEHTSHTVVPIFERAKSTKQGLSTLVAFNANRT
jgi:hypothetical protein